MAQYYPCLFYFYVELVVSISYHLLIGENFLYGRKRSLFPRCFCVSRPCFPWYSLTWYLSLSLHNVLFHELCCFTLGRVGFSFFSCGRWSSSEGALHQFLLLRGRVLSSPPKLKWHLSPVTEREFDSRCREMVIPCNISFEIPTSIPMNPRSNETVVLFKHYCRCLWYPASAFLLDVLVFIRWNSFNLLQALFWPCSLCPYLQTLSWGYERTSSP